MAQTIFQDGIRPNNKKIKTRHPQANTGTPKSLLGAFKYFAKFKLTVSEKTDNTKQLLKKITKYEKTEERNTDFYKITSRERPKSALYLRLKIVKGGPFGLCETPAGCKI